MDRHAAGDETFGAMQVLETGWAEAFAAVGTGGGRQGCDRGDPSSAAPPAVSPLPARSLLGLLVCLAALDAPALAPRH